MINEAVRDILINHIDGPVPLSQYSGPEITTIRAMMGRGLIAGEYVITRSKQGATVLTIKGRRELAAALADWADAITRAEQNEADATFTTYGVRAAERTT